MARFTDVHKGTNMCEHACTHRLHAATRAKLRCTISCVHGGLAHTYLCVHTRTHPEVQCDAILQKN